jgi:hypothetical protein
MWKGRTDLGPPRLSAELRANALVRVDTPLLRLDVRLERGRGRQMLDEHQELPPGETLF